MPMQPVNLSRSATTFAESPEELGRMGRISGVLWLASVAVAIAATFLPGASHAGIGWIFALAGFVLIYGVASVTGLIPWERTSLNTLAIGMAVTVPVVGVALYLTGGSISYVEPLLVCSLLYAAFFFPARWAWPLSIELVLFAGTPLIYDDQAIENAFLPRYLAFAVGYLAATWVMVGLKRRLVEAEQRQRDIANRDALTGVGNRREFDEIFHRELTDRLTPRGRREEDDSPLALLIFDLDDFKAINDRYGHQVGDAVLREATARARSILRSSDSLARIGGDEFAVIVPGARGESAQQMAESIRIAVSAHGPGPGPTPTASIGWAVFPEDGESFEALMHCADQRMMNLKASRQAEEVVSLLDSPA